jgi:4-amino-4-deoxy-L-arabinose transferase-like glycosyltransferase
MTARLSRHLLWIAAAAPLMAGVELGRRIFANNDDARFAVLAQDVLSHGLRFFPELNGAPYYNKPALLAWLIALASWPAGHVSQFTAALPSALAGVATAFAVWALGRDLFGPDAGRYAALVAVATQGFFLQARLPLPDMLMTLFITLALWQFWRMTQDGARGHHWLGFYGFTALAFWAKGPAGFMPLAVGLGWAIAFRRAHGWRRLRLVPGLACLAALVAPWWLLAIETDSAAVRDAVVIDHLMWYLPTTLTWKSVTSPLRNSFGILFPWVLVIPVVLVQAVRAARGEEAGRERVQLLLVWALVTLVAVGVSRQQRLRYYLPLVPPVALLIAWWLAVSVPRRRGAPRLPWRAYAVAAALVLLMSAGVLVAHGGLPRDAVISLPASVLEVLVLGGGLAAMLGALVWGVRRGRLGRAFALAWLGSAAFVAGAYHWEMERFNAANDFPRVSQRMWPALRDASVVASWGVPELPLSFYFNRPVVAVESSADLDRVMSAGGLAVAIMTEGVLASNPERVEVLMNDRLALRAISLVRRDAPKRL